METVVMFRINEMALAVNVDMYVVDTVARAGMIGHDMLPVVCFTFHDV